MHKFRSFKCHDCLLAHICDSGLTSKTYWSLCHSQSIMNIWTAATSHIVFLPMVRLRRSDTESKTRMWKLLVFVIDWMIFFLLCLITPTYHWIIIKNKTFICSKYTKFHLNSCILPFHFVLLQTFWFRNYVHATSFPANKHLSLCGKN